jgi:hypothetical protein
MEKTETFKLLINWKIEGKVKRLRNGCLMMLKLKLMMKKVYSRNPNALYIQHLHTSHLKPLDGLKIVLLRIATAPPDVPASDRCGGRSDSANLT